MIHCKDSVRFSVLRREIYGLLPGLELIFGHHGKTVTITCGTEGHGDDDPHTHGFAVDLRSKDLTTEESHAIHLELMQFCGPMYTVLLENEGEEQEHLHIQLRKGLWRTLRGDGS